MTRELVPLSSATSPQSKWLVDQLPAVLAEDPFLRRFLGIFEEIMLTMTERVDGFGHFIDLSLAPIEFVRWMGRWVGLEVDPKLDDERQRELVRRVGPLFAWRGTAAGLTGLLEAVTGYPVRVVDGGGVFSEGQAPSGTKWVRIEMESAGSLSIEQVLGLAQQEMPADVEFELRIGGEMVHKSYAERPPPQFERPVPPGEGGPLTFGSGTLGAGDDGPHDVEQGTPADPPAGAPRDDRPPEGEE